MLYLSIVFVPLLIWAGFLIFTKNTITLKESAVHIFAQLLLALICVGLLYYSNLYDHEIHNGLVTDKKSAKVSCEHSYRCNCYESCSGSGENRSCHEVCSTCYEHSYDVSWYVYSTINNYTINREDRQGLKEPKRWTVVQVGDPVSKKVGYANYIKGASDTLFKYQLEEEKYKTKIPEYPSNIYDYYKINKVLSVGGVLGNLPEWNLKLNKLNGELGPRKQVNIIVIITNSLGQDYVNAVKQAWLGGKKNDVIIILDIAENFDIMWADVISWANDDLFNVELRDSLKDLKTLNIDTFFPVVEDKINKLFVRKPMEDYKYLKNNIKFNNVGFVLCLIFNIMVSIYLGCYFHKEDFDGYYR